MLVKSAKSMRDDAPLPTLLTRIAHGGHRALGRRVGWHDRCCDLSAVAETSVMTSEGKPGRGVSAQGGGGKEAGCAVVEVEGWRSVM